MMSRGAPVRMLHTSRPVFGKGETSLRDPIPFAALSSGGRRRQRPCQCQCRRGRRAADVSSLPPRPASRASIWMLPAKKPLTQRAPRMIMWAMPRIGGRGGLEQGAHILS